MTAHEQHPLIRYPTDYTFKVVGPGEDRFPDLVRSIASRALGRILHATDVRKVRPSRYGTYLAVTLAVALRGESERRAVYHAFWDCEQVLFYL